MSNRLLINRNRVICQSLLALAAEQWIQASGSGFAHAGSITWAKSGFAHASRGNMVKASHLMPSRKMPCVGLSRTSTLGPLVVPSSLGVINKSLI